MIHIEDNKGQKSMKQKLSTKMEGFDNIEYREDKKEWLIQAIPKSGMDKKKLMDKSGYTHKEAETGELRQMYKAVKGTVEGVLSNTTSAGEAFLALCGEISVKTTMRRTRLENDKLAHLSLQLTYTEPHTLPRAKCTEEGWLIPHGDLELLWLSSNFSLGKEDPEATIVCYLGEDYPMTDPGEKAMATLITNIPEHPLKEREILTDKTEGVHDICRWALQQIKGDRLDLLSWVSMIKDLWHMGKIQGREEVLLATCI